MLFRLSIVYTGLLVVLIIYLLVRLYDRLNSDFKTRKRFIGYPLHFLYAIFLIVCFREQPVLIICLLLAMFFTRRYALRFFAEPLYTRDWYIKQKTFRRKFKINRRF